MRTIFFAQLDGKTITRFDGSKTVLHLAGKGVIFQKETLKQEILSFMMDPSISFMIFAVGMLCIFFEFNHPGAILPGVSGLYRRCDFTLHLAIASVTFHGIGNDHRVICHVRAGGQASDSRDRWRRRHCADGLGCALTRRWPNSTDERSSLGCPGCRLSRLASSPYFL